MMSYHHWSSSSSSAAAAAAAAARYRGCSTVCYEDRSWWLMQLMVAVTPITTRKVR